MELPEDRPEDNDDDDISVTSFAARFLHVLAEALRDSSDEEAAATRSLTQAISTALNDLEIQPETIPHPSLGEPNQIFHFGIQTQSGSYSIRMDARPSNFLLFCTSRLNIPTHRRAAVAEYICRVNYILLQGCLQMDMGDGEVRYKIAQNNAGMTAPTVVELFQNGVEVMDRFFPGIMAVTYTDTSPEQAFHDCEPAVLREVQEELAV